MSDTYGLTKTLGVIDIYTDANGEPRIHIGNNSIIFHIRHQGEHKILKCYTRDKRNLRRIYGGRCLREELFIHSDNKHGEWVDVICDRWIEGVTLHQAITDNLGNPDTLSALADEFDLLAHHLLAEEWAHGDLKPENIVVTPTGELQLIDFDAMFRPEFAGESSDEIGTAAFQHPSRNSDYFDKSIDDYPIALISTALHALAIDPTLAERFDIDDALLMHPKDILSGKSEALDEILHLFATQGDAIHYRIAQLLRSTTPKLHALRELISFAVATPDNNSTTSEAPTLDARNGLWGYRCGEEFVIPPLYNCGFEFSDGVAAVCIEKCWHYIDINGRVVLRCPHYEAVKPFRNGEAVVIENGEKKRISLQGEYLL